MNEAKEIGEVMGTESDERKSESSFLRIGGSLFYSLSALSILWGLSKIIGPVFGQSSHLWDKVACVGALSLYESLIFGLLIVLIVWKQVKDDAVSLLVIAGIFYVAGGIVNDTIAAGSSIFSYTIGIGLFAIAVVKIFVMKRYSRIQFSPIFAIGLSLFFAWNYLISSLMRDAHQINAATVMEKWRFGWLIMLAAGLTFLIKSMQSIEFEKKASEDAPGYLINTQAMVWIFVAEITTLSIVHQYILTYIYDIRFEVGDYIPFLTLIIFTIIGLSWKYGKNTQQSDIVLSLVPLGILFISQVHHTMPTVSGWFGFFWNPGVVVLFSMLCCVCLTRKYHTTNFFYSIMAYFLVFILLGVTRSSQEITMTTLNIKTLVAVMLSGMVFAGLYLRIHSLLYIGTISICMGIMNLSGFEKLLYKCSIPPTGTGFILIGLAILLLYSFTSENISKTVAYFGVALLGAGVLRASGPNIPLIFTLSVIIAISTLSFVYYKILKEKILGITVSLPIAVYLVQIIKPIEGWHYIALSFILLVAGGLVSIGKKNTMLK